MMIQTTTPALSRKLCDLSGWNDQYLWQAYDTATEGKGFTEVVQSYEAAESYGDGEAEDYDVVPAYDLGYLLDKIPFGRNKDDICHAIMLQKYLPNMYGISWEAEDDSGDDLFAEADTPTNAAAKLAISLFEAGILQKEERS